MKIILSRKGFDSGSGGCASPILPDGTMLSLPIPDPTGNYTYEELSAPGGVSYRDILKSLNPNKDYSTCHLDPDIRSGIRFNPSGWIPAFGQIDQAQTHLNNQAIQKGDLFLFFGWFRKTEYHNGKLRFVRDSPDIQAIYGYLQIGEIIEGTGVKRYPWHPHSDDSHIYGKNGSISNNTIYIAADKLIIDGIDSGFPGAGTLAFSESRVLTAEGKSRTQWKLNDVFENVNLSYHDKKCVKDGYFQSRCRGQEFVFDEDPRATAWAKRIINN